MPDWSCSGATCARPVSMRRSAPPAQERLAGGFRRGAHGTAADRAAGRGAGGCATSPSSRMIRCSDASSRCRSCHRAHREFGGCRVHDDHGRPPASDPHGSDRARARHRKGAHVDDRCRRCGVLTGLQSMRPRGAHPALSANRPQRSIAVRRGPRWSSPGNA